MKWEVAWDQSPGQVLKRIPPDSAVCFGAPVNCALPDPTVTHPRVTLVRAISNPTTVEEFPGTESPGRSYLRGPKTLHSGPPLGIVF
jgi:hypothetical protein